MWTRGEWILVICFVALLIVPVAVFLLLWIRTRESFRFAASRRGKTWRPKINLRWQGPNNEDFRGLLYKIELDWGFVAMTREHLGDSLKTQTVAVYEKGLAIPNLQIRPFRKNRIVVIGDNRDPAECSAERLGGIAIRHEDKIFLAVTKNEDAARRFVVWVANRLTESTWRHVDCLDISSGRLTVVGPIRGRGRVEELVSLIECLRAFAADSA